MLVATFGPSTAWHGREIVWDTDHFILVGHGGIPAAGLLDYDRQGQIVWARPEYRTWAFQVDQWERGARPAQGARASGRPAAGPGGSHGRMPAWAIVLIVVVVIAAILGAIVMVVLPGAILRATDSYTNDLQVRSGVHTIQTAVEAYASQHGGRYPGPGEVNQVGLGSYLGVWPQNPYTELPMGDGGGAGNFRYDVSSDGGAYRLIGYGRDGSQVLELAGGSTDTV